MKREDIEKVIKAYKSWHDTEFHDFLTSDDNAFIDAFLSSPADNRTVEDEKECEHKNAK